MIIVRVFIAVILALPIYGSNIIYAQSDAIESGKNSDNKKGSITGSVSLRGYPIQLYPVTVQLYDPAIRKIQMSANVDQSGKFSFTGVAPGDYMIYMERRSFTSHLVAVSVKEGMNEIGEQHFDPYSLIFAIGLSANGEESYTSEYKDLLNEYPRVNGYSVFTVCEFLRLKPSWRNEMGRGIIIGNLVQTPEGSWLEQSCGNPIKSGDHSWSDAIFLNFINTPPLGVVNYKGYIDDHDSRLKEAITRSGKDFIQNNKSGGNVAVAVIGNIVTFDNLLYVKCGEGKTCGFGY